MVEAGGNRFYPEAGSENDSRRVQMLILVANPLAWEMPPVFNLQEDVRPRNAKHTGGASLIWKRHRGKKC